MYFVCNVSKTIVKSPLVFSVINKIYNNMSLKIIWKHKSLNYARGGLGSWKPLSLSLSLSVPSKNI